MFASMYFAGMILMMSAISRVTPDVEFRLHTDTGGTLRNSGVTNQTNVSFDIRRANRDLPDTEGPDTCVQDVGDGNNTCKFIRLPTSTACAWAKSYRADKLPERYL